MRISTSCVSLLVFFHFFRQKIPPFFMSRQSSLLTLPFYFILFFAEIYKLSFLLPPFLFRLCCAYLYRIFLFLRRASLRLQKFPMQKIALFLQGGGKGFFVVINTFMCTHEESTVVRWTQLICDHRISDCLKKCLFMTKTTHTTN